MSEPGDQRFTLLVVCTANLCRSPMIEWSLRHHLSLHGVEWAVSSAGIHAQAGLPMHPFAAAVLAGHGIDVDDGWRSRRVDSATLAEADLILAVSSEQRAEIVLAAPQAVGSTFLFRQFNRLVGAAGDSGHWPDATLLELAGHGRAIAPSAAPAEDDIDDPIGRSRRRFGRLFRDIDGWAAAIADIADTHRSIR